MLLDTPYSTSPVGPSTDDSAQNSIPNIRTARRTTQFVATPALNQIDSWLQSPPTQNELWQYALEYRWLGWNVIPVHGKKPVVSWKQFQTRRAPLRHLKRLIDRDGVTGIAAITGWISGHKATAATPARKLCVRDFDTREAFSRWAKQFPVLAATLPRASTKRGYHVYCWSFYEAYEKFADGELKAKSNGFVLLPPSLHPDGLIYRWEIPFPLRPSALPILDPKKAGFYPSTATKVIGPIHHKVQKSFDCHTGDFGDIGEKCDRVGKSCLEFCHPVEIGRAEWDLITMTLPDGPGQRHQKIFELARRLKGLTHLANADATSLLDIVRAWWNRALPIIRTKDWNETWRDFRNGWTLVVIPAGDGPFQGIIRASALEMELPELSGYSRPEVRRLIMACRSLQRAAESRGAKQFFLSCRTAADACGFRGPNGYRTAARWIKRLVEDGVLELVKPGLGGLKNRFASEYQFRHLTLGLSA